MIPLSFGHKSYKHCKTVHECVRVSEQDNVNTYKDADCSDSTLSHALIVCVDVDWSHSLCFHYLRMCHTSISSSSDITVIGWSVHTGSAYGDAEVWVRLEIIIGECLSYGYFYVSIVLLPKSPETCCSWGPHEGIKLVNRTLYLTALNIKFEKLYSKPYYFWPEKYMLFHYNDPNRLFKNVQDLFVGKIKKM